VKISIYKEDFNSIVSLASIYGLSEDETYELVIKNTDIDQKFYINGFSKDIKRIKKFKVDKSDNSNVDQGDSNTAFSKYLRVFNNVTPVEFLATRFNCNPPKFMIDELTVLKEDFGLNNSVINVVLDYSIKQTKGVFNQTFIEKVAATISENNIQDAYQAMVALNSRDFEKGKRKSKASEMKEKHVNNDSENDERKEDDLSDLKDFYDL
jgi:replication initiation and membrane attachment protein DnaB